MKYLLIVNAAVFILQAFTDQPKSTWPPGGLSSWLGVTAHGFWQLWRYVTFQFLHADLWHIVLNMLGLYLFGSPLERAWGPRRFLMFYLTCGAAAGAAYAAMGVIFFVDPNLPIVGASGGVYGTLLACAVLFPHIRVLLLFIPLPIRVAAVAIFGAMILTVAARLSKGGILSAASDVAHLGGALAAGGWIWLGPMLSGRLGRGRASLGAGRWERKRARQRRQQEQVDRILEKISRQGLRSLSWRERRELRRASRRKRQEDRFLK